MILIIPVGNYNRIKAKQHFIDIGEWQKFEKPVMHHIDESLRHNDIERYNQWNPEDLVVMELSDHTRLHMTEDSPTQDIRKTKISESMTGRRPYNNGMVEIFVTPDTVPQGFVEGKIHYKQGGENHHFYGKTGKDCHNSQRLKVTLLFGDCETRIFDCCTDKSLCEFLRYGSIRSAQSMVSKAVNQNNGLLRRKYDGKLIDFAFIEYI